jgi:hypothetical protein
VDGLDGTFALLLPPLLLYCYSSSHGSRASGRPSLLPRYPGGEEGMGILLFLSRCEDPARLLRGTHSTSEAWHERGVG